jgi:hypothetical protein
MTQILSALTLVATLTLGFTAHAADKKIGNVIAVERSIDNVFQTCTAQVEKAKDYDPKARYFACSLDVSKAGVAEMSPNNQRLLRVRGTSCTIDADLKDTSIFMMFNGNDNKAGYTAARACLKEVMDDAANNDGFKFTVFTVE